MAVYLFFSGNNYSRNQNLVIDLEVINLLLLMKRVASTSCTTVHDNGCKRARSVEVTEQEGKMTDASLQPLEQEELFLEVAGIEESYDRPLFPTDEDHLSQNYNPVITQKPLFIVVINFKSRILYIARRFFLFGTNMSNTTNFCKNSKMMDCGPHKRFLPLMIHQKMKDRPPIKRRRNMMRVGYGGCQRALLKCMAKGAYTAFMVRMSCVVPFE